MDIHFIENLERALEEDLPGKAAHQLMTPFDLSQFPVPEDYRIACVLILLYPRNKEWHIALLERPTHNIHDLHAGQISLPGGKFEESDYSYQDCALREANEEIGVDQSKIGIVGELSSVYAKASNFMVYPFVGFTTSEPEFNAQPAEVAQIIELPLEILTNSKHKKTKDITASNNLILKNMPYYDYEGHTIWGVTGMILKELEEIIIQSDL